ncbi:hypothetical protein KFK09_022643 [Dendrobium nobile]|uniref:Uncharacterized protein n=1 Tax=Dendrobium nobile TaxID=94219 RepID=A0A8T3AJA7_DENNO|nr:hypothetical protein KFK09_022643 [Dendrobium nobile]
MQTSRYICVCLCQKKKREKKKRVEGRKGEFQKRGGRKELQKKSDNKKERKMEISMVFHIIFATIDFTTEVIIMLSKLRKIHFGACRAANNHPYVLFLSRWEEVHCGASGEVSNSPLKSYFRCLWRTKRPPMNTFLSVVGGNFVWHL